MRYLFFCIFLGIFAFNIKAQTSLNAESEDKLIITYIGDADQVSFEMLGGISRTLKKDPESGLFKAEIKIPALDSAIFTYDLKVISKDPKGKQVALNPESEMINVNKQRTLNQNDRSVWIGRDRKPDYKKNDSLTGSLKTIQLRSRYLKSERAISVYTPEEIDTEVPIIYVTDGKQVANYAAYIDRLILEEKIIPVKLIGVHAHSSKRYEEYVQGTQYNEVFQQHENFFFEEVVSALEAHPPGWKGARYLYGVSNGAAFAIYAGLNHPQLFKEIVAFSIFDYISPMAQITNPIELNYEQYPSFYLGAGRYENSIYQENLNFSKKLKKQGITVNFSSFTSGHDYNVWRIEFLDYLCQQFKK